MSLINSISGVRGTIGGKPGEAFTPIDIVKFTSAFSQFIKSRSAKSSTPKVVVGRDARVSGEMVENLVCGTLMACGIDVVRAGLASTPTVEMAVVFEKANGGIILTASHNPKEWNALKLINEKGEFLDAKDGTQLMQIVEKSSFEYSTVDNLGITTHKNFDHKHIEAVLSHPLIDKKRVSRARFRVVLDAVNSVGGVVVPQLLEAMGVEVVKINCETNGLFSHNPEPLPQHLTQLSKTVVKERASLGIAVDPDVDRLAIINEDGTPFGEEYTLVAVADYVLSKRRGATVSNLSSSRALKDVTESMGEKYYSSAVGEVNVVTQMKRVNAVIGGEGSGGIILPDLHYGRDALIGIALFLSHLANMNTTPSLLKKRYPKYEMVKERVELSNKIDLDGLLEKIKERYSKERITTIDGVRIDFEDERKWVHLRKSNTEPIIRIFSEAPTKEAAEKIANQIIKEIKTY